MIHNDLNEKTPLFSIITPAYNSEKWIIRCIESVITQTCPDWEMIIVDDGSTDNTPSILDSYSSRDKRIVVIHQDNKGFTAASNRCLANVKGKYVLSVDSDNWLENNRLLDSIRTEIDKYDPDIIQFPIKCVYLANNKEAEFFSLVGNNLFVGKDNIASGIRSRIIHTQTHGGKAIRREILANVFLYGHPVGADTRFTNVCLARCKCISTINEPYLMVEGRTESLSHTSNNNPLFYYEWIIDECEYLPIYKECFSEEKFYFPQIEGLFDLYKTSIINNFQIVYAKKCGRLLWRYKKLFIKGNGFFQTFLVLLTPAFYVFFKKLFRKGN